MLSKIGILSENQSRFFRWVYTILVPINSLINDRHTIAVKLQERKISVINTHRICCHNYPNYSFNQLNYKYQK